MNARALLLTAGLLLIARDEPPPMEKPAEGPPAARTSTTRTAAVRVLRLAPGILDEAPLKGGEERAYLLDLAAGQYAELVVDQQGIDVEVRLRTADGRTVASIDGLNGTIGSEPLPVVAATGGRFRLEIRSITPGARDGRYVLRLDVLRPATERDHARTEAERLLAESLRLCQEDTRASLRAAVARGKEAIGRFRTLGLPEREAEALFCLGTAYTGLGAWDTAADFYQQALPLFGALGDEAWMGGTLSNLGRLERARGRPERALTLYRQALPLVRRSRNRPAEAMTLNNISRAAMNLGETGEAISALEQAISLARAEGDRSSEGKALSTLGRLETNVGQIPRALDHLRQAADLLESLGDRRAVGVAVAYLGVARVLAGHARDDVMAAFQRALQLQRATGDLASETVTLEYLGWYYHREGEHHQAERIFRKVLALFSDQGNQTGAAAALVHLGGVDLELGRLAQAEESFARALALFTEIGDPDKAAAALLGLARVRRAAGRTAEALTAIEDAAARVEVLRRKPADLDFRLTFFASKQDIYELRVDLLMELHRLEPRAGYDVRALLASEDARARTLLDLLDKAHVGDGSQVVAFPGARVPNLQEIQRQVVEPGTLLLEYYLGRKRSFLWAVTPEAVESVELPPREVLEDEARRAALLLGASNKALARQQAELTLAELANQLLAPVAHRLGGAQRLVIIPDGALWYISFAALPDPGAGGSAGDRPPLVVGHEIVTLPSLSALPRWRKAFASPRHAPGTIAVVADPVFSATDPRVALDPAPSRKAGNQRRGPLLRLERLPFSRAEAEAILEVAPLQGRFVALDFDASREMVLSGRLKGCQIVHFATHAILDTEHPERSGVALSMVDPHGRPRDGFLRLDEIYRLNLPADLVVLSACRTALGREIRGEGLVGLTRGFFSAGARQVLVSLWPVDDRATAELMKHFYREMLGRGRPPAAALREAQIAMWRNESWRSACHWAGFILQGDWLVTPNKPLPPDVDLSPKTGQSKNWRIKR